MQPLRVPPAALITILPPLGRGLEESVREALALGADAHATSPRTPSTVVQAARTARMSPETIQLLIDRGVRLDATLADGVTALDAARWSGNLPLAELLGRSGAQTGVADRRPTVPVRAAATPAEAVQRSLPLLQRTAAEFYRKGACVSCHHNSLSQITVAAARAAGFVVDESAAHQDVDVTVRDIDAALDRAVHGIAAPGGWVTTTGYILMGLAAERHPADAATDALVRLIRMSQRPDGRWFSVYRPPIEASEITATAVSLRGLQLYGSRQPQSRDAKAVRAAAAWLERAVPHETEDYTFRLRGLTWVGASARLRNAARRDLITLQRADDGWGQLPALASDAYATGQALVALAEAGLRTDHPVYRRGVEFLLRTQLADGSWFVASRSQPTQAYFESGFPHGLDQFISAAATHWATQALVRAAQGQSRAQSPAPAGD